MGGEKDENRLLPHVERADVGLGDVEAVVKEQVIRQVEFLLPRLESKRRVLFVFVVVLRGRGRK